MGYCGDKWSIERIHEQPMKQECKYQACEDKTKITANKTKEKKLLSWTCGIYDELNDSQNVSTIWTKRRNVNETTNNEWQNKRQAFGIIKNFPPQHTQHVQSIRQGEYSCKFANQVKSRIKVKSFESIY